MTDAQQSSTALQNEYESIPDADLDAAERKVLEMLELSAKIAEDLAGGLEPAPRPRGDGVLRDGVDGGNDPPGPAGGSRSEL